MRIHVSRHEWWAPGPVGVRGRQGSDITNNKAGVGRGAVRRKKYRVCSSADDLQQAAVATAEEWSLDSECIRYSCYYYFRVWTTLDLERENRSKLYDGFRTGEMKQPGLRE